MSLIIRQSTAIDVAVGPFLDSTDGVTAETGLTITQPDIRLSKNAAAFAQKSAAQTASHMENGYYSVNLSTTDTNTVGSLVLHVNETGALPVFLQFQVIEEATYDLLFAASATGQVTVTSINAGAITAAAIATDAIDADAVAANAIDADAIATGAITSAKFAAGAVDAAAIATSAVTEIATGVADALKDNDRRGTAQGDGSGNNTLVLAADDAAADDFYNSSIIILLTGAGTSGVTSANRIRQITDYVNSTNEITVDADWVSAPDNTTVYLILGG